MFLCGNFALKPLHIGEIMSNNKIMKFSYFYWNTNEKKADEKTILFHDVICHDCDIAWCFWKDASWDTIRCRLDLTWVCTSVRHTGLEKMETVTPFSIFNSIYFNGTIWKSFCSDRPPNEKVLRFSVYPNSGVVFTWIIIVCLPCGTKFLRVLLFAFFAIFPAISKNKLLQMKITATFFPQKFTPEKIFFLICYTKIQY